MRWARAFGRRGRVDLDRKFSRHFESVVGIGLIHSALHNYNGPADDKPLVYVGPCRVMQHFILAALEPAVAHCTSLLIGGKSAFRGVCLRRPRRKSIRLLSQLFRRTVAQFYSRRI
jgi:hypothetical protein